MNTEETLTIMGVLKAAYPSYYKDMSRRDAEGVVSLWQTMFADEPVELVAAAVKAHIATDKKGFPPHIGAIKDAIVKLTAPQEMTEAEAWGYIFKATQNSTWSSKEEFDKLPPILQRLVGSPNQLKEWAAMPADEVQTVVASNFQRSYRARAASEREFLALPADIRQTMTRLAGGFAMDALPSGGEHAT